MTACPGAATCDDALAEYERRRNEATMPDYRMNLERARFTPISTTERMLRAALHGNTEATRQFFLTIEGLAPREVFFGPEKWVVSWRRFNSRLACDVWFISREWHHVRARLQSAPGIPRLFPRSKASVRWRVDARCSPGACAAVPSTIRYADPITN